MKQDSLKNDAVGAIGELGFNDLFGGLSCGFDERIAFIGEYIHNVEADDNETLK